MIHHAYLAERLAAAILQDDEREVPEDVRCRQRTRGSWGGIGLPRGGEAAGCRDGSSPSNKGHLPDDDSGELGLESFEIEQGRLLPSSGMLQKSKRGKDQRRTLMVDGAPVMLDNLGPIIVSVRLIPLRPNPSPPPQQGPPTPNPQRALFLNTHHHTGGRGSRVHIKLARDERAAAGACFAAHRTEKPGAPGAPESSSRKGCGVVRAWRAVETCTT